MKFNEVKIGRYLVVHDMATNPFEGVFVGTVPGQYGDNYKFESNGKEFVVFSTNQLHQKMIGVKPGYVVRITKIGEHSTNSGHNVIDLKIEVSSEPAIGYESGDLS